MSRSSQQKAARRARRKANGKSKGKAFQGVEARKRPDDAGRGRVGRVPRPTATSRREREATRALDALLDTLTRGRVTRG